MSNFVDGGWPTYIGKIIIWFSNVDAHVNSLIERCGSRELREKLRDKTLADRAKHAREVSLAAFADDAELTAEIEATFDQVDEQIERVRNHVAHPIPTFVLTTQVGGSQKLGFRRRGEERPVYMTLAELGQAASDSALLADRIRAIMARVNDKFPKP